MRRILIAATAVVLAGLLAVAARPPQPLPAPSRDGVVENITLVQPGGSRQRARTVVIENGRITAIRGFAGTGKPRFLLPGLIDMHVHQPLAVGGLTEYFALLYLKHGVTS